MDLQQLKGFIAVAREKNFSKAAQKVFRTQSAVSLQVKALEEELGTKLFDRISPRKTELTKDGSLFFELAGPLVQDLETLQGRFNERKGGEPKGEIRIATHDPVIAYLLPRPIKQFRKAYPDIRITLLRKGREEILSAVQNNEVDLGISSFKKVPPSLEYQVIGRYDRVLIGPKGHPLSKEREITLEEIAKYPLLLPPENTSTRKTVDQAFRKRGLDYTLALEATGRQAIKSYIDLGFGISVFNESLISKEDKKRFFTRSVANLFGQSERGILMRKNKSEAKYVRAFIQLIREQTKPS